MMPTERRESEQAGSDLMLASNAEREMAVQRLQVAFAEHRLDDDEFGQRVRGALSARTTAELAGLTAGTGRWSVPRRFFSVVYKGDGLLDIRAAELTSADTTIVAVSYKSRTEIVLPPGVRVELGGTGVSAAGETRAELVSAGAPVMRVKGVAYKGTIEVRTG